MNQHRPRSLPALRASALAVSAALASFTALAANTADTATDTAAPVDTAQVIVTAQSRSQQLQNVPIAMQALSGEALKDLGAANLGDVDAFVPGLSVTTSQPTRPQISLRGVGTQDFGVGTDSPVGIYTDGVYTGKTGGSMLNFNDVKRIEVLKGPQGTLFGRNAAAGAISIVTNEPNARQEASALVRIGNDGLHHEELMVNLPLSDTLALRISAVDQTSRGWALNTANGSHMGGDGDRGARIALGWHGDDDSAVLSWEHEKMSTAGPAVFSLTGGKINFAGPSQWINPLSQPLSNDALPNVQSRDFDGVTLRVEHKLPFAMLTSTTAYRHFTTQNWQDADGSSNPAAYLVTGNVEGNTTWQQEFKLNGQAGPVDWVAGASAFAERVNETENVALNTTSLDTVIKASAGLAPFATITSLAQGVGKATANPALLGVNLLGQSWQEAIQDQGAFHAAAIYGDAIWHLDGITNLTVGGRYTQDRKSFSWYNPLRQAAGLDAQLAILQQAKLFQTATALKLLTAQQSALLQSVVANNVEFTNPVSATSAYQVSRRWNDFSPRVVLDRHLSQDHMLYASWSKGYQAGGFDAVGVNGHYDAEHVTSIELGAKGQLPALGVSYAVSAFHYTFTNLQSLTLVAGSASSGVPAYQVVNSDQQAKGVDIEGQWKINRIFRLTGSAEYIDQNYQQYTAPSGVNLSGQPVGTPHLSATVGVAARWPMLGGNGDVNLQYGYTGASRCNADTAQQGLCLHTDQVDAGAARERVDLHVGWTAPGKRWGVGLVVNNLTDKQYISSVSTLGGAVGSPYAYITRPRSVAIEFRGAL